MKIQEVNLTDVMEFRELKASIQAKMLASETEGVIVSLGMNIPGPIKSNSFIFDAFREGRRCLEQILDKYAKAVVQEKALEERAGYAAIYLTKGNKWMELKKAAVHLEETHPIGRLFDIDVLTENEGLISRETVGAERRKCLLCGRDAKACGRNRTHSVEELQGRVYELIEQWKVKQI